MSDLLNEIPSRKFVPLVRQIGSRLGYMGSGGQTEEHVNAIHDLFLRMGKEHTQEVMLPLFELSNGNESEDRTRAAVEIINALRQHSPAVVLTKINCDYTL